MKKVILLSLIAFVSLGFQRANAISVLYGSPRWEFNPNVEHRFHADRLTEFCPKVLELEKLGYNIITYFPKKENVTWPVCSSSNVISGYYNMSAQCKWKVGDYADDGILLYNTSDEGLRIFVYTDDTDFITDECFYDEYIYVPTKNFKYTSVIGRTIVVKAYKKTEYKYRDFTKGSSELF